ncbi:MAG: type ISP restriction/modification enzyme [Planctomycetota bacterium]
MLGDIFYYVYGVLHHPGDREKSADNLKRELPRIPLAPPLEAGHERSKPGSGVRAFAKAGKQLAKLHVEYESVEPWPLKWIETPGEPLSYTVEKMRLGGTRPTCRCSASSRGSSSRLAWVTDQFSTSGLHRCWTVKQLPNRSDEWAGEALHLADLVDEHDLA